MEEGEQKEDSLQRGGPPAITAEGGKLTSRGRTGLPFKTLDKEPMLGSARQPSS